MMPHTLIKSSRHRRWMVCLLMLALPGLVSARVATTPHGKKSVHVKKTAKRHPSAKQVVSNTTNHLGNTIADTPLTTVQMALAEQMETGRMQCELGTVVTLTPSPASPGYFDVQVQGSSGAGKSRRKASIQPQAQTYRMTPVRTRTGALQIEDPQAGVAWLQLANKSMLMNQRLGQRLADACVSPAQFARSQTSAPDVSPLQRLLDTGPVDPQTAQVIPPPVPGTIKTSPVAFPRESFTLEQIAHDD